MREDVVVSSHVLRKHIEKISVVVVDDHPLFLAGLQQLFKKQPDFELVGVAEDAAQLETVLAQTTPAVIRLGPAHDRRRVSWLLPGS